MKMARTEKENSTVEHFGGAVLLGKKRGRQIHARSALTLILLVQPALTNACFMAAVFT